MEPQNPHFRDKVKEIFAKAGFINDLGIKLETISAGYCETKLLVQARHMQQDQFIHAGVQATIADHTAGAAAGSLIKDEEIVLTIEFKINLLRPAVGEILKCQAKVLRPGKNIHVAESEVFTINKGKEKLVAKSIVTLAVSKSLL